MTTAITTIQRTARRGGIGRFVRRLATTMDALNDRIATWCGPYHENGTYEGDALAPEQRLDAALRWQARHGRVV